MGAISGASSTLIMPRPTSGLRRRRTALFAIAVSFLMTGGAESDVVEGVNDLRGSTSCQELVPPLEGSSTAELQVVGAPQNHDLGSAGADAVTLQSEGAAESDRVEGVSEHGGSMLNQEQVFLRKLVDKMHANLAQLELVHRNVTTKTVYIEQLETMCNSNPESQGKDAAQQKSAKIKEALVQVQLPPDMLAKSKAKVEMIQLIKSSLMNLLGLWKLDNAHGMHALRQEARKLVNVEKKIRELSVSGVNEFR